MNSKMPELKDIITSIYKYNTLHREGCFIFSFVGFKKDLEHKCKDCGDNCDIMDKNKSMMGAYGDKPILRSILNGLRDMIEDEANEDGFVCI
jgi:hypothetical protein